MDPNAVIDAAKSAESLGIIGFLVAALLAVGAVSGLIIKVLIARLDAANATLAAERDRHAAERKEHAAELRAINERRIEDLDRLLEVISTFTEARKAIASSLEQVAAMVGQMKDRLLEIVVRQEGRGS